MIKYRQQADNLTRIMAHILGSRRHRRSVNITIETLQGLRHDLPAWAMNAVPNNAIAPRHPRRELFLSESDRRYEGPSLPSNGVAVQNAISSYLTFVRQWTSLTPLLMTPFVTHGGLMFLALVFPSETERSSVLSIGLVLLGEKSVWAPKDYTTFPLLGFANEVSILQQQHPRFLVGNTQVVPFLTQPSNGYSPTVDAEVRGYSNYGERVVYEGPPLRPNEAVAYALLYHMSSNRMNRNRRYTLQMSENSLSFIRGDWRNVENPMSFRTILHLLRG